MSIASGFKDSLEYFEQCLVFLHKFSWIYETSNTCFIRDNVLEKFPSEWVQYFTTVKTDELNALPSRNFTTKKGSLNAFIQELRKLIPSRVEHDTPNINFKLKKMSVKKQHEISKLSSIIQSYCGEDIDVLIDFGSGLGYLSELLYKLCSYKILGLESDASRVRTSCERQYEIYPSSKKNVVFKQQFVTTESKDFIVASINEMTPDLPNARLAIIGLHACADLTVDSMKLFFAMENVRKLIIMPCCYHKLEINEQPTDGQLFKNFPLSKTLKKALHGSPTFRGFNRPFLRLACQQTSARWKNLTTKEHANHSIDMYFRALAEAILSSDEIVRKANTKQIKHEISFDVFCTLYELRSKTTEERLDWSSEHEIRFAQLTQKYPHGPELAEGLTCLQTILQELCENIVLYDRLCFMEETAKENNLKISAKFEKITNELISPRCYALIAQKI